MERFLAAATAAGYQLTMVYAGGDAQNIGRNVEGWPALSNADAYAALNPVKHETAPPVPESLARTLASHRPPRYFRDVTTDDAWEWSNGKMFVNHGEDSIFASPGALLDCPGIIEVDESGEPLKPSAEAIAAEKGDREQQREADES